VGDVSRQAGVNGRGPDRGPLDAEAARPAGQSPWQSLERRVLLSKLNELEEKAGHLQRLEAHLRDLAREVDLLSRLSEAAHAIHRAGDLSELLDVALRQSVGVLRAEKGSLLLHEPEANELVVARACGASPASIEGVRLAVGQGVAGYVALHREPLRVEDIARDGRFAARDSQRYATGSFLCVPVQDNGSVLAVLSAADRADRRSFSEEDLRAALSLAGDFGIALKRVREAGAARAMQRQLVSKLAHELRNPLDGALRFVNLSLGEGSPEECRRRYLVATKQGLERLSGIVEGLLGLGSCAEGSGKPADVNELVTQAVALQEGKAQQRGVRVELALAEGLPPVAGGVALFQVFTNLVSNALDAMEIAGGTLRVSTERVDGAVVARVADSGPGIAPEVLARLFTPFFTTKPPGRGMGLGLAVCREVLERLRGRIQVESEPGHGTVFTVAVPCATR